MGSYSREPTEADLEETRATLRKIAETERARRVAETEARGGSTTAQTSDADAPRAIDADAMLLDPRTVAAALSSTGAAPRAPTETDKIKRV